MCITWKDGNFLPPTFCNRHDIGKMQSNAGVWIALHRQAILATGEKPEDAFVYFDNGCWQVPPHPAVLALYHHLCEGTTAVTTNTAANLRG
jgi:hypothetical protein